MFLKARYFQAKLLFKIREFTKAEFTCDQIIGFTDDYQKETPQIYWKFAVKVLFLKSKMMEFVMEFRKSREYLEKEAKSILKRLIDKF